VSVCQRPCSDRRRGDGRRETGIERNMCDERGKLVTSHAVVARSPKVDGQLLRPVERDQRGDGGNAAIARAQCRIGPDVAIKRVFDEFGESRGEATGHFPWRWLRHTYGNLLISSQLNINGELRASQDFRKASRSALSRSLCVSVMPCGAPG
jgi:hypothetical protein